MTKQIIVLTALLGMLSACTQSEFTLGRNNPEADIQTCNQLSAKKRYEAAIECYEIYKSRYRNTAAGQEAELHIGDSFFARKEYLLATESYDAFIRNHPLHARVDYAFYRMGLAFLKESPKQIDRDQEYLDDAMRAFRTQLRLFPESSYRDDTTQALREAETRVGRRHYYIGNFYYRTGEYIAAISRLEQVIGEYPQLREREKAYGQLVQAYAGLGQLEQARGVYTRMQDEFESGRHTKRAARALRSASKKQQQASED